MSVNVNRNVHDTFYRYKMPRLMAKVEGKGNGIKTVLPNMVEVARALGRPPTYPTKFFGCELGAQTQFDYKNDRYIINGCHEASKLQDMLDIFIKKFVLCEKCDNPETVIKVSKKAILVSSCKACGHAFTLDMRHKLTTFIIKNPPEQEINSHGTSLTKKQDKKSKRRETVPSSTATSSDVMQTSALETSGLNDGTNGESDDGDWCDDVSEEAVARRLKLLTSGVKGLTMDDSLDKSESVRINIFHHFFEALLNCNNGLISVSSEKEIFNEAKRLEILNKAPMILCELLLSKEVMAEIKRYSGLFLRFTEDNHKAQRYLMGGVEMTIGKYESTILAKVPFILKEFYDLDILDEEILIEWNKKASRKYVSKELSESIHKKAEPFINWLIEAEEDEDSEQDEIDLVFDEKAKISSLKEAVDPPITKVDEILGNAEKLEKIAHNGDDEEIDIDDI